MKKLAFFFLLIAVSAFAGMDGKVYEVEYGDINYTLTFKQGPFSPEECGTVSLYDGKDFEATFHYQFDGKEGNIDGLPFKLNGETLELFQKIMEFKEVKE